MRYTNLVRTIAYALVVFLSVIAFGCAAQVDTTKLSNKEINEMLDEVDTLSGDRNYHVLLKSEDNKVFQVYIWINNRLGETMFKESEMNICRFYSYEKTNVFVYEFRQCEIDVPISFLREASSDSYAYLNESPFYVENGFHQAFLVKKEGSTLERTELELIDENGLDQDLRDLIEF